MAALCLGLSLAGCATVGRNFPDEAVDEIRRGQTTQEDILRILGEPWRTGVEDGQRTWTYARYRYSLFGGAKTKDLVLRFDEKSVVVSYTYSTTDHDVESPADGR